jgi:hypothetical protein
MTPTLPPAVDAPRLTFRHWLPFTASDSMTAYVEVVERVSKKKVIPATYAVRVAPALPSGARVFHVFKQGDATPREVRVYPAGFTCTCESGKYRPGKSCRHLEAIQHLTEQGVI